ncbi:hypothetical protein SARC_06705 [Sphaeroforma arctica JP610]|uniref:ATP-dependent DNA ligase family profile domain-containing protein n=1 Tax=Sphaeroforma arctica JP610 TaxID=667725 RepID=A0A0L0FWL6_9EUKA|nr:hypothetical protein SARC_06705 [Sphaeroforma arctica JP610]KNC80956.1 hypothetical protein SARC_06705 [Sphaeroforma arctica JP610]|eukprot:XP_014154858.1 hypothetical protein SARC_06705 [Sphaeroforma arctica JP610]
MWSPETEENSEYKNTDDKRSVAVILRELFAKLTQTETKWVVRIILQDLRLGRVEDWLVLNAYNPFFNYIYRSNKSLTFASQKLYDMQQRAKDLHNPKVSLDWSLVSSMGLVTLHMPMAPMGCAKGASISSALSSMYSAKAYVETKYDGERIQIHVGALPTQHPAPTPSITAMHTPTNTTATHTPAHMTATHPPSVTATHPPANGLPVEIFSRGGRRSTLERSPVIPAVLDALQAWEENRGCDTAALGVGQDPLTSVVLDGELLTYNNYEKRIEDFGYVQVADISYTWVGLHNRRVSIIVSGSLASSAVSAGIKCPMETHAGGCTRYNVYLSICGMRSATVPFVSKIAWVMRSNPTAVLRKRHLMVVLFDVMYLNGQRYVPDGKNPNSWVKLKREYIPGLADTVDLVIFGGTFQSKHETRNTSMTSNVQGVFKRWHVGCIADKFKTAPVTIFPLFTCDAGLSVSVGSITASGSNLYDFTPRPVESHTLSRILFLDRKNHAF